MALGGLVTVYEFRPWTATGKTTWMSVRADTNRVTWVIVNYPKRYPLSQSIATGVETAISLIRSRPGRFVLVGTSIGAIIASNLYDELRTGRLKDRRGDLIAGLMMMNPRRQSGTGFPGSPELSGRGMLQPNLTGTEDLWWEFPIPSDPASTWPDDDTVLSLWGRDVFADFLNTYAGTLYETLDRWINPQVKLSTLATAMQAILAGTTTDNQTPATYKPLYYQFIDGTRFPYAFPFELQPDPAEGLPNPYWPNGNPLRTVQQIALDRINSLVVADADTRVEAVAVPVSADGYTSIRCRTADTYDSAFASMVHRPPTLRNIIDRRREDFPPPWWPPGNARTKVRAK